MIPVSVRVSAVEKVNKIAHIFKFTTTDLKIVRNWKKWYSDSDMIGRHFLIYSSDLVKVKRQYTICNSIIPNHFKELLNACS